MPLQYPPPSEPLILADEESKVAYVAIPKCAMTSCLEAWEAHFHLKPRPVHHRGWPKVLTRKECAALGDDWLRFTVVRDPRDRLVSLYYDKVAFRGNHRKEFLKNDGNHALAELYGLGVAGFMLEAARLASGDPREMDRHMRPQSWFLQWHGALIVDTIVPLWHLPLWWYRLRERIGIGPLGSANENPHPGWREVFGALRSKIGDEVVASYGDDLVLFGDVSVDGRT